MFTVCVQPPATACVPDLVAVIGDQAGGDCHQIYQLTLIWTCQPEEVTIQVGYDLYVDYDNNGSYELYDAVGGPYSVTITAGDGVWDEPNPPGTVGATDMSGHIVPYRATVTITYPDLSTVTLTAVDVTDPCG